MATTMRTRRCWRRRDETSGRHRVLVLNHFAADRGSPGGTRHVELFARVQGWSSTIIASNRNLLTRRTAPRDDNGLRAVWTSPYSANGLARILNWITFAVTSTFAGISGPRPDIVYASSPHLLTGLAGWVVARMRTVPFVLEVRDLWPKVLVEMGSLSERSALYRVLAMLEAFLYGRARAVVVFSEGVAAELRARGVPMEKLHVIPNGAEPADFDPPAPREDLRTRYGFDRFTLVYAGAHGPANGLALVLDAAQELHDVEPDVEFAFVGDGVEKVALVEEAKARGLDNVRFMDPVAKAEMPALLGAADTGLHVLADVPLFRYGVSPNKLYDYMAAGLPVITNTPGETAALVEEAACGIAVEPHGIAEAVRAMVAGSDEQRRAWGHSGRAFMEEHRSRRVLGKKLEALLDRVATS